MKIILNKTDLEEVIKSKYSGVTGITFKNVTAKEGDIEVELTVNSNFLMNTQPIETHQTIPPITRTLEEKNQLAKAKGLMVQGGQERNLVRF